MIDKNISEIETKIRDANSMSDERKRELLELLGKLKGEVSLLATTHREHADSITGFANVSAHEAMREKQNPQLREISAQGLRSSVGGFEQSHPQLVQLVNNISNLLSNLGI
jgi:Mg2+ and Co2+ transporter CorA